MKSYVQCASALLLLQGAAQAESPRAESPRTRQYEVVEDRALLPILTPSLADRKTAKLRLDNGLEVYLISDPGVEQSAAALSVRAGSWSDPEEYPGMAHFCEHMLFMGNAAYPEEFAYMQYITDHGGKVNASTYPDHTSYYFSVNNDALFGALDRFSHFFIDPLFARSGIDRELHAVDQEHAKNIEHDGWRQYMVFKETANPYHPIAKFSTGNAETLSGIPREALYDWYHTHYTAKQMHLIVISALPLDALTDRVVESFSPISRHEAPRDHYPKEMSTHTQRGHMVYIKPVRDLRTLSLQWEVLREFANEEGSASLDLIAYALSNSSKNSLIAQLKREQLAESISVSKERFSQEALFFTIDLSLTEEGLAQIDTTILRCFQAIAGLKAAGIPFSLFQEQKALSEIEYQYQSREDAFSFVMTYALAMLYEDLETFPLKSNTYSNYDPALIEAFLSAMEPDSCLFSLIADPTVTAVPTDRKERWMGVEYAVKEIGSERRNAWKEAAPHPRIALVSPNPFVPENLSIAPLKEEGAPVLLARDALGTLYYAPDSRYSVPESAALFTFKTPLLEGSARSNALADLYLKTLQEKLSHTLFFARAAGLSSRFSSSKMQLTFFVQGYSDKMPLFLEELFAASLQAIPSREEFILFKHSLMRDYSNASKELSLAQAHELLNSLVRNDSPPSSALLSAIRQIDYEEYVEFAQALFKKTYVEGLFYGNLPEEEAESLWTNLKNSLAAAPYPKEEQHRTTLLLLPEKQGPYMITQHTDRQGNAALLMLEEGPFSFEKRAVQQIVALALRESFFVTLRTRQQTGYIVKAWDSEVERQLLQFFAVQSNTHYPGDLLARFELFLEEFLKNMREEIPLERFETIRKMLVTTLKMPPENMAMMAQRLNTLAFDYEGDFEWINKRIKSVEAIRYEQFLAGAHQFLSRANPRRLAILVEGVLPKENDFHYEPISKEELPSIGTFVSWR